MREDEVALAADLAYAVNQLRDRFLDRLLKPQNTGRGRVSPAAGWPVQTWWNRQVVKLGAKHVLSQAATDRLMSAFTMFMDSAVAAVAASAGQTDAQAALAVVNSANGVRRWWNHKIRQIATTEATARRSLTVLNAGRNTPGSRKRWITMEDDRVRPSHILAGQGPPIPLMVPFMVGGYPMMRPGDGPAEETVGCRCELEIVK